MFRLFTIVTLLFLTSCSDEPEPEAILVLDVSGPDVRDVGVDVEPDGTSTPLQGEPVSDLSDYGNYREARLFDSGDYLFVWIDRTYLVWLPKAGGVPLQVFFWPPVAMAGSPGPAGADIAITSEHAWFLAEIDAGVFGIVGVEHLLGAPTPFFGQPIVIIDVGPDYGAFAGITSVGDRVVAGFTGGSEPSVSRLITADATGQWTPTALSAALPFDRIDLTEAGPAYWSTSAAGVALAVFDAEQAESTSRGESSAIPSSSESIGAFGPRVAWFSANGLRTTTGSVADVPPLNETSRDMAPVVAVGPSELVWSDGDVLAVGDFTGRQFDLDSAGARIDSIVVDASAVFWTTDTAVWTYRLR